MKLGENIARLRKLNMLTATELSSRAGIKQSYLSQIESGKRTPSLDVLRNIAKELDVTVSELLGETKEVLPDDIKRLLKASRNLNHSQIDAVIGIAEAFGAYDKDKQH